MTRNLSLRRLVATAALLTLVFGACGGGDGDSATESPDMTASSAGAADDGGADSGGEAASTGDTVQIVDFNFKPEKLEVEAGTTVTWTNDDKFAHTVTAEDDSFDSGNMDEGATFEHTFEEAGTFDYVCSIHPSMTASVTVS